MFTNFVKFTFPHNTDNGKETVRLIRINWTRLLLAERTVRREKTASRSALGGPQVLKGAIEVQDDDGGQEHKCERNPTKM